MKTSFLDASRKLPLVAEPENASASNLDSLLDWAAAKRDWIEARLLQHGALLLRGFDVQTAEDFERFCKTINPQLRNYAGGDSPRDAVTGKVYTSTEYPANLEIPLHNEMSYRLQWPRKLFFFCQQPPLEGGATNLADSRRLLRAIDPDVRQRFAEKQVAYVQNLHAGWGLGKSWQETFETNDREQVETLCQRSGIEFRWTGQGLWTRTVCPSVIDHPETGEPVWFNQATLWHVSSRGHKYQDKLLRVLGETGLPSNATYGDGTPISAADLDVVRRACRSTEVDNPWQRGDLLLVDNVLVAHGRKAFHGPRRVLVAMADCGSMVAAPQ